MMTKSFVFVYIKIFVTEHRIILAEIYAINVIDRIFSFITENVYVFFVQVPQLIMQLLTNLPRLQRLFN